jgi:hypothetical protein
MEPTGAPWSAGQPPAPAARRRLIPAVRQLLRGVFGMATEQELEGELRKYPPGARIRVKWHPAKKHGSETTGVILQAYVSKPLYREATISVVFKEDGTEEQDVAAIDLDEVTVLG